MKENKKYYTTKEAAEMLGLCEQRIRAMLKQDQNPNRQKTHFKNVKKNPIKWEWLISEKDIHGKLKKN